MPIPVAGADARRVLHVPPTAKDGETTAGLLARAGVVCLLCRDLPQLAREIPRGAGALLLTEEALVAPGLDALTDVLAAQPAWSDLPVVLLMRGGAEGPAAPSVLPALRNVTLLARPAPMRSVLSAVTAGLRARERQYQIRDQIETVRQAEARLRESEARFQAMANSIPQLAWMARPDGWIFWYNQRWHDYCGSTPEEMQGWGWTRVHHAAELPRVMASYRAAIATGEPWEDTFPIRRHDGEYRWHLSRARPLRNETGRIELWFGTNTDITDERRRMEERERLLARERAARTELEQAARMKDEFLATLSHELRTPLNAILGWSQLLRRGDQESMQHGLVVIERNARVQVQLIEDLLDMSRIVSGKIRLNPKPVEPVAFIEAAVQTIEPAARAKNIEVRTVVRGAPGAIHGDADRLQQVVWNLLANAVKFTPHAGWVELLVERTDSQVAITITDSGPGIPAEFLPYLFQRFQQADASTTRTHRGLGLGLAIVRHLVELHGGSVAAANAGEGRGASFTVTLPVAGAPLPAADAEMRTAEGGAGATGAGLLHGLTVLVVDDEADARELIREILEGSGAGVLLAGSAAEAFAIVERDRPDVLVSDIGMPGTDGYALLRQIRALGPERNGRVPAVALTAFARPEDRGNALRCGYLEHVAKPVEPQELVATVALAAARRDESEGD